MFINNFNETKDSEILTHKGMVLNKQQSTIYYQGKPLPFTPKQFQIVQLLMEKPDRVFTRKEIYEQVWGAVYMEDAKTMNVHIFNIRKKFRAVFTEEMIETVWGIGFKLKE